MGNATQSAVPNVVYRFGLFALDAAGGTLTRNGIRVKLQDQPFQLLLLLLQRSGQIVSREEIQARLWPRNTFVEFDKSLSVAVLKVRESLADEAANPRFVETIPRRGYRFIAPITVETTSDSATEIAPGQDGESSIAASSKNQMGPTARRSSPRRWYWIPVLGFLAMGFVVYALRVGRPPSSPANSAMPSVRVRRSIAVLGFRNIPGRPEDNWLSPAFAEMLNTELAADGALRMVSGEDVARAKRELPLIDEDSLAKATLERLRVDPGADVIVLGSYTPLPGKGEKRIRLDIRVQDTTRGEMIAEQAFVGSENDLFELVRQAGESLRQSLGAAPVSTEAFAEARAALPRSPLAVRLYTEGRARLWAFDYIHARELLIQAIGAEPGFPLAHAALADVWNHLGYTPKARNEVELARALSERLGPEEHLLVEGQYYSLMEDRPKAIDVYRKLFAQFPDSLDYGLRLADEQRWVNTEATLQTLDTLRHLPVPAGEDPRIDLIEARAWTNKDFVNAQAAAHRAVEKGTAHGSHQLVSRAYGILCQMSANGSSTALAIEVCEQALKSGETGTGKDSEARTMNDFAGLYYQMGDLDRAEAMFRRALKVFREVGDIEGVTATSSNLGDVSLARGNLSDAANALSDAIPGYREIGDKDGVALALNDLGEVARFRGDLGGALATYQQAKAAANEIDDKHALGYVLTGVGDVLLDRGDLDGARKSYQESLSLRKQVGEKQTVAETDLALARLFLEENQGNDAETVIRKCKEEFHQDQEADDELAASVALVNAFLGQGKSSEAAKEVEDAKSLAAKSVNELIRLQFDIVSARVESGSGDLESSRRQLQSALQKARSHHLFGLELETRLALAELNRRSGKKVAAQADLLSLEDAARSKGFGLIAAKASRSAAAPE